MPIVRLNKKSIEQLKVPDPSGKQMFYRDHAIFGFGVLVSGKKNSKKFVVYDGKHRISLGPTNVLSLDEARDQALNVLGPLIQRPKFYPRGGKTC
jgi:hypothetical protein